MHLSRKSIIIALLSIGIMFITSVCNAEFIVKRDQGVFVTSSEYYTQYPSDDGKKIVTWIVGLFKINDIKMLNLTVGRLSNEWYYFAKEMYIQFDDEEPIMISFWNTKTFMSNNLHASNGVARLPLLAEVDKCKHVTLRITFEDGNPDQILELPDSILQEWKQVVNYHPGM